MKKTLFRRFFLTCIFFSLSACSLLSPVKTCPPKSYLLYATACNLPCKKPRGGALLVMRPETYYPYDTMQIAYSRYPYNIGYFTQSKWGATPSQMLQKMIVQTLQDTGHYRAVMAAPYPGNYRYYFTSQILSLIQDYSCYPPILKLSVRAQIASLTTNKIIATKQFDLIEPIKCIDAYSGVLATNRALARLLTEIAYFAVHNT